MPPSALAHVYPPLPSHFGSLWMMLVFLCICPLVICPVASLPATCDGQTLNNFVGSQGCSSSSLLRYSWCLGVVGGWCRTREKDRLLLPSVDWGRHRRPMGVQTFLQHNGETFSLQHIWSLIVRGVAALHDAGTAWCNVTWWASHSLSIAEVTVI